MIRREADEIGTTIKYKYFKSLSCDVGRWMVMFKMEVVTMHGTCT